MVRPESALRRVTRELEKLLQPYGFHGGEPAWVRPEPGGLACVGRTRTFRTWRAGQQVLEFGLTLGATPTAWWEFCNWRNAQRDLPPTPFEQATGPGLLTDDGLAAELTGLWSVRLDQEQGGQHVLQADIDAIRAELPRRVHAYARRALRLLEPGRYLDELLAAPEPRPGAWEEAIAILLADHGPSPHLDEAFDRLRRCFADPDAAAYAEQVIGYARDRAGLVGAAG
ncbi:hypothetical protein [Nocardia sp. alder85J]|uniref:hypothetical protein n=1 Tax=Nocardia sp. alder85J TaxID=2862949 RepID=UPI001CD23F85|nr:hypothetical protein [Nocardia sp. alder85J]MCX4095497.1 hypothetical protein [Nocardia sp. alder85J]